MSLISSPGRHSERAGTSTADELRRCLKFHWGHDNFRRYQREVIEASMSGRDAFVLMSTGAGKSVCYQLPAVFARQGSKTGAVTVVVSPLISLMQDQVMSLRHNNIQACYVGSTSNRETEDQAIAGHFPLVFITPEKLAVWDHGLRAIESGPGLALFAVDESHCMVEWGHDFRPSYGELSCLREKYPRVPIMALTATATPTVQSEIVSKLGLRGPTVAKTSFNRGNLHYSIKSTNAQSLPQELSTLLKGLDGSAIIYVLTKKDAEQITADAARIVGAKGARTYHAGMSAKERTAVHYAFIRDEIQVVVATVAFGMGIDKPDVRMVIHCGLPKTVEGYYQQTGRAGRDGQPARCVLLFSRGDAPRQRSIMAMATNGMRPSDKTIAIGNKLLAEMEKFVTGPGCRRKALLKYFGENMGDAKCEGCDACDRAAAAASSSLSGAATLNKNIELFTAPARLVLQAIKDCGERFGSGVPISLLMGTKASTGRIYNAQQKPSFGKGKERGKNEAFWKALFHQLHEREGFIKSEAYSSAGGRGGVTFALTAKGKKFLFSEAKLPVSFTPSDELATAGRFLSVAAANPAAHHLAQAARDDLSEDERKVHQLLFSMRSEIAKSQGIPPYNVLGAAVLKELAKRRPIDLATLPTVDGMAEKKVVDYGAEIIRVLTAACKDLKLETNLPATPAPEAAWLSTRNIASASKPVTEKQRSSHTEYTRGSRTVEDMANSLGVKASTVSGHLAACMEGGMPVAWDRRRLGIDERIEEQVMGILEHLKSQGEDPLETGFRLKPIFEELPQGTDSSAYGTIRLIISRLRFEREGGRLPGSGGKVLAAPPSAPPSAGKKRALPAWGAGSSSGGLAKKASPPKATAAVISSSPGGLFKPSYAPPVSKAAAATSSSPGGLFKPSYAPSVSKATATATAAAVISSSPGGLFKPSYAPPVSKASATATATAAAVISSSPGGLFKPSYAPSVPKATATATAAAAAVTSSSPGGLFKPSYAPPVSGSPSGSRSSGEAQPVMVDLHEDDPVVVDMSQSSEPWTREVVMKVVQEAGGPGASIEDMLSANPGNEGELRSVLDGLLEDFALFTKPAAGASQLLYVAL